MIRINLLPYRAARKKENVRRQVSIFFLSLILVLVMLAGGYLALNNKISRLQATIKRTEDDLKKYNQINAEIARIKKRLALLKKKTDVINELQQNRLAPVILLDTMTRVIVPERMWFTNLQASDRVVRISGVALDNKTVADFMTRLEGSQLFQQVDLKSIRQQEIDQNQLKAFEIHCTKPAPRAETKSQRQGS
jgi:type IV pilus assembly protein PilN